MSLSFTSSGESSSAHQAHGKQMSSGRGTTPRFRYRSEDLTSALCCCRCPCNMLVLAIDRETVHAPCSWTPQCCRLPPQRHFPPVVAQMGIHAFTANSMFGSGDARQIQQTWEDIANEYIEKLQGQISHKGNQFPCWTLGLGFTSHRLHHSVLGQYPLLFFLLSQMKSLNKLM